MGILFTSLVAASMWLRPSYLDRGEWAETRDERQARMEIVATAIDRAVDQVPLRGAGWRLTKPQLGFLLLGQAFNESALQHAVHAGQCGPHQCDVRFVRVGVSYHAAHSLWQIHESERVPHETWEAIHDETQEATLPR